MAAVSREIMTRRVCVALVFLASLHLMATAFGGSWWSLGVNDCALTNGNCDNCQTLRTQNFLTGTQVERCSQDQQTIRAVSRGARDAIIQCQATFYNRKWNCSTFFGEHLFGSFVELGTRETAVLNAYFSIGAISALARACREQRLLNCPCATDSSILFSNSSLSIFASCSDNLDWAIDFARDFIVTSQLQVASSPSLSDLVGEHNVDLGKDLLAGDGLERVCRCHGISGTCTAQTCYDRASSIEELSETLLTKYLGAVKVQGASGSFVPVEPRDSVDDTTLVFQENTPDFCDPNPAIGIIGTRGRQCSPDFDSVNYCANVCCQGLFRTVTYEVPEEVCAFVWCCRIECNIIGNKTITEYLCRE